MRVLFLAALVAAAGCVTTSSSTGRGAGQAEPKSEDEKTLYMVGVQLGGSLDVFALEPDELAFVEQGMRDKVTGQKLAVEEAKYAEKVQEMARARRNAAAEAERKRSQAFLDEAAKEEGAVKSPSGMVYRTLKEGTGPSPVARDHVKVHYRGTLMNGSEFDSSYRRGEPAEFPLDGVIACWTEGVQRMKVGGKAKLTCPSNLAYGERGSPPKIPGGATLVFEVELLGISDAPAHDDE